MQQSTISLNHLILKKGVVAIKACFKASAVKVA